MKQRDQARSELKQNPMERKALILKYRKLRNKANKVQTERSIRPTSIKQWKDYANLKIAQESFTIDAARLWNMAPLNIKQAESLQKAKTNIKIWCSQMTL